MLIAEDAHVMLSAAISTRNINLITDTIMCITDLVAEIQSRFIVAVKPGVGRSMRFGPGQHEASKESISNYPCSQCDRKFASVEGLQEHTKIHVVAADNSDMHSASQRLYSLSSVSESAGAASTKRLSTSIAASTMHSASQRLYSLSSGSESGPAAPKAAPTGIKCYICEAMLPDRSSYTKHLKTHNKESAGFKCADCKRVFESMEELRHHMMNRECLMSVHSVDVNAHMHLSTSRSLTAESSRDYSCPDCPGSFSDVNEFHNHLMNRECLIKRDRIDSKDHEIPEKRRKEEHPTASVSSADCNDVMPNKSAATERKSLPSLECPLCGKTFEQIFQLNLHLSRHQDTFSSGKYSSGLPIADKTYSCQFCLKEYNNMSNRKRHEKMCKYNPDVRRDASLPSPTTQQFPIIPQAISPPSNSSNIKYNCKHCSKPFSEDSNRRRHERVCHKGSPAGSSQEQPSPVLNSPDKPPINISTQSSELPLSAANYKRLASTAPSMKVIDEGGRIISTYSCVICAKLINTRNSLEHHYMTHLGIKPHACRWCTKRFTDPSNWRKHERSCCERPPDVDMSEYNDLPTMVPHQTMMSQHSVPGSHASSSDTRPLSTSSSSVSGTSHHVQSVKLEPVDITSDGDMTPDPPIITETTHQDTDTNTFDNNTLRSGELHGNAAGGTEASQTSETQQEIGVTPSSPVIDSVVVDSSWFVGDQNITAMSEDDNTS